MNKEYSMQCIGIRSKTRRNRIIFNVVRSLKDGNRTRRASVSYWRDELNFGKIMTYSNEEIQNALTYGVRRGKLESEMTHKSRLYGLKGGRSE